MIAHLLVVTVLSTGISPSHHHRHRPIEDAGVKVARTGPTGTVLATSAIGNIALRVHPGTYEVTAFREGEHPCDRRLVRITPRTRERHVNLFCPGGRGS
jgi:hypothetical protein